MSAVPAKQIRNEADLQLWEASPAFGKLTGFIQAASTAVKGKTLSDPCPSSEGTERLLQMLDVIESWIAEIPPAQQAQRYGNKSFRVWIDRLNERAEELVRNLLPAEHHSLVTELRGYLVDSFGNRSRIDYGSGHELTFVAFGCCVFLLGVLSEADLPAFVLRVFNRYLKLVRNLQLTYMLEPAGSHGVWGLDDYQFLPYFWGASQLQGSNIKPSDIPNPKFADQYGDDYMFFACIRFILKMKTGPFHEHSRYLYDISGVAEWTKVNLGLFKMYRAEVLLKFPVIQHFLFGTLLDMPAPARRAGHEGHGHDEKDDCETSHKYRCCCPITVPREDEDDSSSAVDPDPFNPTVVKPGVPIAGPVVPGTDPRKTKGANGPARGSLLALRKGQGSPAAPADASVSAGGAQPPAPES